VSGSAFTGNSAGHDGGAIFNAGQLTQSDNTFAGNTPPS
jgi:predicted outer membrane repeat protein